MNWENADSPIEESKDRPSQLTISTKMETEQRDNELIQLKKFQDPTKNQERQSILSLLTRFGDLFTTNNIANTTSSIFTEDCEFFLFSSTRRGPVKYCLSPKDLSSLYSGMQILQRIVKETYIDLEKMTAFQFCSLNILYQDEVDPVEEIVAEVFTVNDNKIRKYRAFFAQMTSAHGDSDPFEVTRKDRVLAMVTQVNYALAGQQPDLAKVAAMLHEDVKYKIWNWDSQKCFVLGKQDFVESFKNMQENLVIKSIIPYEVYTESQVAVGTYLYHLEGIADKYAGKKYMWLCTCFYMFDDENKITRVSQQGELHLEGEVPILFEVYSREKLIQKVQNLFKGVPSLDLFYGDVFALNCTTYVFAPEGSTPVGCHKGTTFVDKNTEWLNKQDRPPQEHHSHPPDKRKEMKLVESFVECSDSSYDIVLLIHTYGMILDSSKPKLSVSEGATIILSMTKLEHGKIFKAYGFLSRVPEPIPTPFDGPEFDNEIF